MPLVSTPEPSRDPFDHTPPPPPPPRSEPISNLPGVIVALAGLMTAIHAVDALVLSQRETVTMLLTFAFLPARYLAGAAESIPGGEGARVWSFLTYAFLHGSWMHLIFNMLWMVIFGGAVARRFGALRFLLLSATCAVAGAAFYLLFHIGEVAPMVGASAAISGHMAAATRFVFQLGGPLGAIRRSDPGAYRVRAAGFREALAHRQVVGFLAVWFGINLLFGLVTPGILGEGGAIAWEAHIGGFVAGFVLFSLFDPLSARRV
ncbi:MAG: rhomboid family intramembrane serine protease [Stappia sp.]|jgi:membrane associated rhomboid family serine protease|nr:rhomboid family intramembrane serine protease [Stappia sp.]MBM22425.1 rhomboid family intramembrane serine protease [Stappia sp.]